MTLQILPILSALACIGSSSALAADAPQDQKQAVQQATLAAEQWLKLVDAGEYARAWQASAGYLKQAAAEDKFVDALNAARKPLGKLASRKIKSQTFRTSLPGAPDGRYVVIQFESSLEHKRAAIETVTPMREPDGSWRVSGYFIR